MKLADIYLSELEAEHFGVIDDPSCWADKMTVYRMKDGLLLVFDSEGPFPIIRKVNWNEEETKFLNVKPYTNCLKGFEND